MVNDKPLAVERCRFVKWQPSGVSCLAFGPLGGKLAVGRDNGDIEIWNCPVGSFSNWFLERRLVGNGDEGSVRSLIWVEDNRLISSGLQGELTQWNINTLSITYTADSYGGPIWDMKLSSDKTRFAIGCDDGSVRVFKLDDEGFFYHRTLPKQEARVLSVSWSVDGNRIAAGLSNSSIVIFDLLSSHAVRITVDQLGANETMVWALAFLSDGTLISGDSLGGTRFWDSELGTLIDDLTEHSADILALAVHPQEKMVFATGVDNKVTQFSLVSKKNGTSQWTACAMLRPHTHDVRALALCTTQPSTPPFLVSGAVDSLLCAYPDLTFEQYPKKIFPYPLASPLHFEPQPRMLLHPCGHTLDVWVLPRKKHTPQPQQLALRMQMQSERSIVTATVSPNGRYLCVVDDEVKLFALETDPDGVLLPHPLPLPHDVRALAPSHVLFTPDSTHILTVAHSHLTLATVAGVVVAQCSRVRTDVSDSSVALVALSYDGQWVAVADTAAAVTVHPLDSLSSHFQLPHPGAPVTAMCFADAQTLALTTLSSTLILYDVEHRKYSARLPAPLQLTHFTSNVPPVCGLLPDPSNPNHLLLHNHFTAAILDLSITHTADAESGPKKRKRQSSRHTPKVSGRIVKAVTKYSAVLHLAVGAYEEATAAESESDSSSEGEGEGEIEGGATPVGTCSLLLVERPWLHVLEALPEAKYRHKYGE